MWPADREWRDAALDRLTLLAEELRRAGVAADLAPDRRPFPALLVRPAPDTATRPPPRGPVRVPAGAALILAGSAHYWCQRPDGDLRLIGSLNDPTPIAEKIIDRLRDGRSRTSRRVRGGT